MTRQQAVNMMESAAEYICHGEYTEARGEAAALLFDQIQAIRDEFGIDIYETINYGYASREKYVAQNTRI